MADVTWSKLAGVGNSDVFEVAFTATDKTTPVLQLDPTKETTVAIQTTATPTVQVDLYFEDPDNAGSTAFTFESAAATASGEDWVQSALGPISGVDFTGTVAGTHTATIQVIQSARK